jgi:hypothetical protein
MSDVFVSFSRGDRETGLRIVKALGRAGLAVWNDEASQSDSRQERELAIESAQCVVAIWSKAAKEEYANQDEFSEPIRSAIQAWSSGRLVLATLDDTKLPIGLRDLSPIAVKGDSGISKLVASASAIAQGVHREEKQFPPVRGWWVVAIAACAVLVLGVIGLRSLAPGQKTEPQLD